MKELDCLITGSGEAPLVNQVGLSLGVRAPFDELLAAHRRRGVALQANRPLGGGSRFAQEMLDACAEVGKPRRKTAQQVALRWLVQKGVPFCIHSTSPSHLREALDVVEGFSLANDEVARLGRLAMQPLL